MPEILLIGLLALGPVVSYLYSLLFPGYFIPQILALLLIPTILLFRTHRLTFLLFLSYLFAFLVITTGGTHSPVFYLSYFLVFILGFQFRLTITLTYSLILIIILAQTLNSASGLASLFSLVFITPIVWFIEFLRRTLQTEETDFHLWSSLRLRSGLNRILDAVRCLGTTSLNPDQRRLTKIVRDSVTYLLSSLDELKKEL